MFKKKKLFKLGVGFQHATFISHHLLAIITNKIYSSLNPCMLYGEVFNVIHKYVHWILIYLVYMGLEQFWIGKIPDKPNYTGFFGNLQKHFIVALLWLLTWSIFKYNHWTIKNVLCWLCLKRYLDEEVLNK